MASAAYTEFVLVIEGPGKGYLATWTIRLRNGRHIQILESDSDLFHDFDGAVAWGILESRARGYERVTFRTEARLNA